jgi:transketolase
LVGDGTSHAARNITFGAREHAMAAMADGLAAPGGRLRFTATFFTFSGSMRPWMRLAAIMGLHVLYVFTHDSVAAGGDGPTHEPIEHAAALRAILHPTVVGPSDENETAVDRKRFPNRGTCGGCKEKN